MIDPFRGEMTAKHLEQENLDWARRERLVRAAKPAVEERKLHWSHLQTYLGELLHRHLGPQTLPPARMAH